MMETKEQLKESRLRWWKKYHLAKFDLLVANMPLYNNIKIDIMKNNIETHIKLHDNDVFKAWSEILMKAFLGIGAENYAEIPTLEMSIGRGTGRLVCTVQKVTGKTPHELRREAENKCRVLEEKVKDLESKLKGNDDDN